MLKKLKEFIKNHDKLYVIARCMKNINEPNLVKILRGYYDNNYQEVCTLLLEHNGDFMPDRIVYDISRDETKRSYRGFCADMHHLLYRLKFAEEINAVPRVHWGENIPYYDHGMDNITQNAFEYYFEPVSETAAHSPDEFKNYIRSDVKHIYIYQNMINKSYKIEDINFKLLADMYKKYIHLNERTKTFIDSDIDKIFNRRDQLSSQKILGIHVRGTDFNLGLRDHPNVVAPNEYLAKAKEVFSSGKYDKIFIATEDSTILEMFISEFGDKILYYKDVFRTSGKSGPHSTPNDRELNNYKLGLEVLRDVYTLANCDGFISGLSHVAFAARYINIALDRKFDAVYTIDKGINYDTH